VDVLQTHRIMVTTPQVLLDALRHGYIILGRDISLLVFDEAHHAVDNHPYNRIMQEFYFELPAKSSDTDRGIVRPTILGLTASPIFGGNVGKAFQTIEGNLNSIIRSPRRHRSELATFVHRPVFRHVMFTPPDEINPPFSTNVASLWAVIDTLDIENDPYVRGLRRRLSQATPGTAEYHRLDQKLSKVIQKQNSFTHKGLCDVARSATEICLDLGPWAADWYVWQVIEQAKRAANPHNLIFTNWKNDEKAYLLSILNQVVTSPVSYYPDDIVDEASDKVQVLISCLLAEKKDTEAENESYSSLIFVQRRDTVLALSEVLRHHPLTNQLFHVGCLLGTSDNSQRHSLLDITRTLVKEPQEDTLLHFKIGEKNLIVSTAVAEEGIDIQACGSVIRWDPPPNMASWAQSRGRARRQRSTFTLMFAIGQQSNVAKWETLEREMVELYNDPSRELDVVAEIDDPMEEEEDLEFRIPSTGAVLTLHSAVSHLSHFCAVIPSAAHVDNRPLYDIDPPEIPQGWHSFDNRSNHTIIPHPGPFGSTVTLPRSLPLPNREFATPRIYKTKISAHRHAAFMAYRALYDAELLNDNLLPITSVVEPHLEEEVKAMLQDVEKRAGTANVSLQMDPWAPEDDGADCWWKYELVIDGLPALNLFTRSGHMALPDAKGPLLYRPGRDPAQTFVRTLSVVKDSDEIIAKAQAYTKLLFWSLNGSRMKWDQHDFSYLLLPSDSRSMDQAKWRQRRKWVAKVNESLHTPHPEELFADAQLFGMEFSYPTDISIVRNGVQFARPYRFVHWRFEPVTPQEEEGLREYYERFGEVDITYPLLAVQSLPSRTNFLLPTSPKPEQKPEPKTLLLLPEYSTITLLSTAETEYAFLLPSVLRWFAMTRTTFSLRETLFSGSSLYDIPFELLTIATTAPVSQEKNNYQRLETLGDTVLKFVSGVQLLAEYPLWHEGYLTKKKDHAVSNVRLAKEDISKGVYRWIIRDRMLGKKWKPSYLSGPQKTKAQALDMDTHKVTAAVVKKSKKRQELSTKVLADVVESLIGAAYLHGGIDLGYECVKFFDLGLKWAPMSSRINALLSRVESTDNYPKQLSYVEHMLGYTFKRKLLLIEALTHASYEQNIHTPSYERMEFLGDSVLDMVVTDFLYRAPGKNYSPGHIYLRKAVMVNAHILAYICLRCCIDIDAAMPGPNGDGNISVHSHTHKVYLWQCLLHSSPRVLDDQTKTFARYRLRHVEIEEALNNWTIFPWAELTRLQAPKFFSDMIEALLGVVYLDSEGDMGVVRDVMRHLGIIQIMERIVVKDIDVLHPVSRLALWAARHDKELQYDYEKSKGKVSCAILVNGWEEVRCTSIYHGRASQEEVKLLAAEKAIQALNLRDSITMNYKRKKTLKKKKSTTSGMA